MLMTRAFDALLKLRIVTVGIEGTRKLFSLAQPIKQLVKNYKNHLSSPIYNRLYTDNKEIREKSVISGLESLAEKTMMGYPTNSVRAIYKKDKKLEFIKLTTFEDFDNVNVYELEIWKYDPMEFSKNNQVDPLSLYASLKDLKDDRIQKELEKMLEEYEW